MKGWIITIPLVNGHTSDCKTKRYSHLLTQICADDLGRAGRPLTGPGRPQTDFRRPPTGWGGGRYVQTDGRTEFLPILRDFVPYRGRCPKKEEEQEEEKQEEPEEEPEERRSNPWIRNDADSAHCPYYLR